MRVVKMQSDGRAAIITDKVDGRNCAGIKSKLVWDARCIWIAIMH